VTVFFTNQTLAMDYRTTLIIGAGVNKEINPGIDTGAELIQNIADRVTGRTSNGEGLGASLENHFPNLTLERRTKFLMHLDLYKQSVKLPSIDTFMNEIRTFPEFERDRPDLLKIGIAMILGHVVGWEGKTTLRALGDATHIKNTWLSKLTPFIVHNRVFRGADFNIITFNYDRILEKFLLLQFKSDCKRFIDEQVHHVYGRLASLSGVTARTDETEMEFDVPNDNFQALAHLEKNINLIRDTTNTDKIKEVIHSSHKLILMGYGFDDTNNRRLGLHDWPYGDRDMIVNIYPGKLPNFDGFSARRESAKLVRALRIDADIRYQDCKSFLEYALNRKPERSPKPKK
jgi:hypothetical protein